MTDDAGARLYGGLGIVPLYDWFSFDQDNETLRGSEQAGRFRPPDRRRLT